MSNTVPCETCGTLTTMTGTKRCDGCWEVEHQLADYLQRGGKKARAFVEGALGREPLKLYVWDGVFADYTDGIAFALARSAKEARALIVARQTRGCETASSREYMTKRALDEIKTRPEVRTVKCAYVVVGGG